MCRNIKQLFNFEPPATEDEIRGASLQFVRKVTGLGKPSRVNEPAYVAAVDEISEVTSRLLKTLQPTGSPKNREIETAKAKTRSAMRFSGKPLS